jgi:phospholipid transport system transporter-binding protein
MTADIKLSEDKHYLNISGSLNVNTVARLRELGAQLLKTVSNPTFDLSEVTECDSSALALLTAWTRDAKNLAKQASFIHVPSQLMAIAQLSGLDKIVHFSH